MSVEGGVTSAHVCLLVRDDLNLLPNNCRRCVTIEASLTLHSQLDAVLEAKPRKVVGILVVCLSVQYFVPGNLCKSPTPSIHRQDSSPDD